MQTPKRPRTVGCVGGVLDFVMEISIWQLFAEGLAFAGFGLACCECRMGGLGVGMPVCCCTQPACDLLSTP